MGLDSYLYGERYHGIDFKNRDKPPKKVDGFPLKAERLELGYWRKRWDIHSYIVNNFAGGKDECQDIHLDDAKVKQIVQAIKDEALHHRPSGETTQPPAPDERYPGVDHASVKIFEKAAEWLAKPNTDKEKNIHRSLYYKASW